MKAFENSKDFPPIDAGGYVARCVRLIDMGTQDDTMYGGTKRQIFMGFETPTKEREWEDKTQGRIMREPFIVGGFFSLSMGTKANLRKFIEAWFGKQIPQETIDSGFDMHVLLDKTAYINIFHKPKARGTGVKAEIQTIMPIPQGLSCPPRVTSLMYFSLDNEEFTLERFNNLPKYFQGEVQKSAEWRMLNGGGSQDGDMQAPVGAPSTMADVGKGFDDDIPF
jgi:hypothetical protein